MRKTKTTTRLGKFIAANYRGNSVKMALAVNDHFNRDALATVRSDGKHYVTPLARWAAGKTPREGNTQWQYLEIFMKEVHKERLTREWCEPVDGPKAQESLTLPFYDTAGCYPHGEAQLRKLLITLQTAIAEYLDPATTLN